MPKRRTLTRETVIKTAVTLANEAGTPDAVTLAKLAGTLNVRTPSLYNHVDGLDGLREGMTAWALSGLYTELRDATLGLTGRDALIQLAHAYRRYGLANPGVYALILRAPDVEQLEIVRISEDILQLLLLVMASVGIQGATAIHMIRSFRSLTHGFVTLEIAGGFGMQAYDPDESYQLLLNTFLAGLE